MIRTEVVQLTSIQGLAYKQKLTAGGAGITVITSDDRAVFTVNKRDGLCVPYGKVDEKVFTAAVAKEVLELTRGLPYKRLDIVSGVSVDDSLDRIPAGSETEDEDDKDTIDVIASVEYKEFIAQYSDKTDKFSYQLMNKELIQFASRSSVVNSLIAEKTDTEAIVRYIVKSKSASLANNKGMDDSHLTAFIDTFDSMDTRSAFKELRAHLRGKMRRAKK